MLAGHPPSAHTHVREEQDDEDDCEDDVDHGISNFWTWIAVPASVSSDFATRSYPSGGFKFADWLAAERALHCGADDFLRRGSLGAHAMTEDEGCEPRHVVCFDDLPALGCGAGLRGGQQMP